MPDQGFSLSYPVFVVGSPRSGTSAISNALQDALGSKGFSEGHLLPLLDELAQTSKAYFSHPGIAAACANPFMMLSKIGEQTVEALLLDAFHGLYRQHLGGDFFIEKTPGPNMIKALPTTLKIWPDARIVFCKRRAIENIESRRRKWPDRPFATHCRGWALNMEAWLSVKPSLDPGKFVEIDQHDIVTDLPLVVGQCAALLGLGSGFEEAMRAHLTQCHHEKTTEGDYVFLRLDSVDWTEEEKSQFTAICGASMAAYGYSETETYYAKPTSKQAV